MSYNPREIYDEAYFESGEKSNYKGYTDSPNWKLMAEELVILLNLPGKLVLDVGCAYGYLVRRLRELDVKAHGIDISDYAMKKHVCDIIHGDARYLPFRSNIFDLVLAIELIEHIPAEFENQLLDELTRVAKKMIAIRTPFKTEKEDKDIGHVNIHQYMYWITELEKRNCFFKFELFEKYAKVAKKKHPFFGDELLLFEKCSS